MGEHVEPFLLRLDGDHVGELGIAGQIVLHVLDHVRRLVGRVGPTVPRICIHVAAEIRDPVHVEDEERVGAALARAAADLLQRLDGIGALAEKRPRPLGNQDRGYMRDFGGENDFTHDTLPC